MGDLRFASSFNQRLGCSQGGRLAIATASFINSRKDRLVV